MIAAKTKEGTSAAKKEEHARKPQATRETVESIVVAVILAFLFRAFIAEAFVIPTGSMAPTLQGRHMDVKCDQCGFRYRTGASGENPDNAHFSEVTHTTCPVCRHTMKLQKSTDVNQNSFNGDRILVSKFAYLLGEPQRWDVIVFKYPGNAKQNYIKRLIGLPGESVMIRHGDILVRPNGSDEEYHIARKPPSKVRAMLQLVHDTEYVGQQLESVGWPSRWQPNPDTEGGIGWQVSPDDESFVSRASAQDNWLRYWHITPHPGDWIDIDNGQLPARLESFQGQLITDYYEYNDNDHLVSSLADSQGAYWVGDLAIECDVRVQSNGGELLLDLVEGGTHYECRINVENGQAQLSISDEGRVFSNMAGDVAERPTGQTKLRGPGHYRIRYANVDDRILLWVNNRLVTFDGPTTFQSPPDIQPRWSPTDAGDMAPAGIGSRNMELNVSRLRLLRDVYYVAVESEMRFKGTEYTEYFAPYEILQVMMDPTTWNDTDLFSSRRSVTFDLEDDQFFPLGDNSPQSKDARLWSLGSRSTGYHDPPPFVKRDLMIGKALLIYWPHAWRGPFGLPLVPNFGRMGFIR